MIPVEYPPYSFKMQDGRIFDTIRKKWVICTPEEWVRQHFVQYLIQVMQYPVGLIAIEKEIRLGELSKRFDILVYDNNHHPWLMVECKAANIPLTPAVLEQVLRYNIAVPVSYLVITNGMHTMGFAKTNQHLSQLETLPVF